MARTATVSRPGTLSRGGEARGRALRELLLRARTRTQRRRLDARIARGAERNCDRALALRESQLVGPRERRRLATRLEEVLTERVRQTVWSSAVPIDYKAVEVARPVLTEIVLSLRSVDIVEPRGVVLGWRLLTDAASPLFAPPGGVSGDPDRLWHESLALLFALRPLATEPVQKAQAR